MPDQIEQRTRRRTGRRGPRRTCPGSTGGRSPPAARAAGAEIKVPALVDHREAGVSARATPISPAQAPVVHLRALPADDEAGDAGVPPRSAPARAQHLHVVAGIAALQRVVGLRAVPGRRCRTTGRSRRTPAQGRGRPGRSSPWGSSPRRGPRCRPPGQRPRARWPATVSPAVTAPVLRTDAGAAPCCRHRAVGRPTPACRTPEHRHGRHGDAAPGSCPPTAARRARRARHRRR